MGPIPTGGLDHRETDTWSSLKLCLSVRGMSVMREPSLYFVQSWWVKWNFESYGNEDIAMRINIQHNIIHLLAENSQVTEVVKSSKPHLGIQGHFNSSNHSLIWNKPCFQHILKLYYHNGHFRAGEQRIPYGQACATQNCWPPAGNHRLFHFGSGRISNSGSESLGTRQATLRCTATSRTGAVLVFTEQLELCSWTLIGQISLQCL